MNDTYTATDPVSGFLRANQSKTRLIGIVRGVDAALTALAILMAFITFLDVLRLGANYRSIGGVGTVIGFFIYLLLPFFVLLGMDIVWVIGFLRSRGEREDTILLRSASAASLALSVSGFLASFSFVLIILGMIGSLNKQTFSQLFSMYGGWTVLTIALTVIGTVCLLPAAISRMKFYRSIQRSVLSGVPTVHGGKVFGVTKAISAFVRLGIIIVILHAVAEASGALATVTPMYIFAMLALAAGFFASLLESRLALDAYRSLPHPVGSGSACPAELPAAPAPTVNGMNTAPMQGVKAEKVNPYTPASVRERAQTQDAEPDGWAAEPPEQRPAFCPHCGAAVQGDLPVCRNCGEKFGA